MNDSTSVEIRFVLHCVAFILCLIYIDEIYPSSKLLPFLFADDTDIFYCSDNIRDTTDEL